MGSTLARIYVVLSAAILLVVGVVGFFRHEMFNLRFPPAHNVFHLVSGAIGLWAGLRNNANAVRRFGQILGAIYSLVAIVRFVGLPDFGPILLDLKTPFNFILL